jgi:NAD(P)-dependent dehydrogenase (short-subunit alcohol dehydrogenase family)
MKVVVLGASSGLGRCIGIDRAQRGDQVALMARRLENLRTAAEEAGAGTLAIACDVTDEAGCRSAIEQAATELGGIDTLIYATGIGPLAPIEAVDAQAWRRTFDTNVIGAAIATAAALPYLKASKGVAAYLSSVSASLTPPWPGLGAYIVSKAALDKLIETYRAEHPALGFTRIIVGDCGGGEGDGQSQFPTEWNSEYAIEIGPTWFERGYMNGNLLEVAELLNVVDAVVRSGGAIPSVAITPRAPA